MFKDFVKAIQKNLQQMSKDSSRLFTVNVDTEELYNLYLDSFPAGTNEIYRERREYDCSYCRHFIRDVGNVVSIKNGELHTIWGINPVSDDKYNVVAAALDTYVKQKAVLGVFLKKEKRIGTPENREMLPTGKINKYEHFFVDLPEICIFKECYGHTLEGDLSQFRDVRNVFKRSLDEISKEAVDTVLELIAQNSLYKGAEWKKQLTEFKNYQKEYGKLTDEQKELWIWEKSIAAGAVIGKIRNHSIGTLLVNISEGMDLDLAVRKYEQIVAPVNYKRPKAIFTKKMLEDAKKTITELGYIDTYYDACCWTEKIGIGAVSTEHSCMASNFAVDGDEITFVKRLLTELYPNASFSMVSDTYDYWNMIDNILPACKKEIMQHNGKLLVRPDSGDMVEIAVETIEKLWNTFGGTVNSKGYKVLDPHIGIIYGDGCTLNNVEQVWEELKEKGFAANNIVFGVGAFCFSAVIEPDGHIVVVTRDMFGIAMKATYGIVNGEPIMIYKDPKTDTSHLKKSHKGCCCIYHDDNGELQCMDGFNDVFRDGVLRTVFKDGEMYHKETFEDIRERLNGGNKES